MGEIDFDRRYTLDQCDQVLAALKQLLIDAQGPQEQVLWQSTIAWWQRHRTFAETRVILSGSMR